MLIEGLPIDIIVFVYLEKKWCKFKDLKRLKTGLDINYDKNETLMNQLFVD